MLKLEKNVGANGQATKVNFIFHFRYAEAHLIQQKVLEL